MKIPIISEEDFLVLPFKDISTHKINDNKYLLVGEYSSRKGIVSDPTLHCFIKVKYKEEFQEVWLWE